MERAAFEYIYIHANSLVELALIRLAGTIEAGLPAEAPLSKEAREAQLHALYAQSKDDIVYDQNGDATWSPEVAARWADASQGAPVPAQDFDARQASLLADALAAESAYFAAQAREQANPSATAANSGEASSDAVTNANPGGDLASYLQRVYAAKAEIAARVDACMAGIDMEALEMSMVFLPDELPPLTNELDASALAQWLECYASDDFGLHEIVRMIRAWESGTA